MRLSTLSIPFAFLGAAAACTGDVPNDQPDAGGPDAPPGAQMVAVTGSTMDYFSATPLPLSGVVVSMEGVIPAVNNTSDVAGLYSLMVPPGSVGYPLTSRTAFRATRNTPTTTTTPDVPVMQDLYVGSAAQIQNNLYNSAIPPIIATAGTAAMVADLRRNNGMPLDGIPIADVSLVDNQVPPLPVLGIDGPFFLNDLGLPDANLLVSTAFLGRARVAIMNCPVGNHQLKVNYLDGGGLPQTYTVPIICDLDGFTLAATGAMGGGGGGMGMAPQNPTFTQHIFPVLQLPAVAAEGRACAQCHQPGGTGPFSVTGLAADVHAILLARLGVIDLISPVDSMLLTKPLYELVPPQNHPNATFLTTLDRDYIMIMCWIQQGAPLDTPGVGVCDYTGGGL